MNLNHASASVTDEEIPPPVVGVNEKAGFGRDRLGASDFWSKTYKGRISCLPSSKDAWEDEVTAIAYQFSDAKSRLNAFSSIYSIPDEVLAYIFELLVPIFPVKANTHKWGWVSVTHVSRHFRAVAIDHASLWSTLSTDGDTPWNIFLPRSRQTRLVIKVNPGLHRGNGLDIYAAEIIQNLGRVQTLHIGRINFVTYTWLKSCFLRAAPQLQTLRLEVYGQYFSTISNVLDAKPDWPALDHQFLTQGAPELRDLSMTGMQFPWHINAPISLRSLVLDFWKDAHRPCTFADMIRCLENMPLLQDLALWRALPAAISTDIRTRIKLPHLRLLFLADECSRCLALWSSLDIPPTCSIRIETEELEAEDEHHLPEILKDHLAKPHIPSYFRAHVGHPNEHQPYNNMIRVSLHSTAVGETATTARRELPRRFRSNYLIDPEPMLSITFSFKHQTTLFESLLALFGRQPITILSLAEWMPSNENILDLLRKVLRHFCNVDTVEVHGVSAQWERERHELAQGFCSLFCYEFSPGSTQTTAEVRETRYLPMLHTLSLEHIHLWHSSFYSVRLPLSEVLTEALQRRFNAGIPIHTLKISNTRVRDSWFEAWAGLVENVQCDRSTCGEVSSDDESEDSTGTDDSEDVGVENEEVDIDDDEEVN